VSDDKLAVAVEAMRNILSSLDLELKTPEVEEARRLADEIARRLTQKCHSCGPTYSCPIRRKRQWVWRDVTTVSDGCSCVECGEEIAVGASCISVTCHHEGNVLKGVRCNFCHKVSLDYCSQLGHLRETVRNKTGMDYVSGEMDDG